MDKYGNQTEEEVYAQGGVVCACCGCLNCEFTVDDSKIKEDIKYDNKRQVE